MGSWLLVLIAFSSCNHDADVHSPVSDLIRQRAIDTLERLAVMDSSGLSILADNYLVILDYRQKKSSPDIEKNATVGEINQEQKTEGERPIQTETALSLAEEGGPSDLHTLISMLDNHQPSLSREENLEIHATAAYAILRIDRRNKISLAGWDWVVIVFYGACMLGIGWFYAKRNKTEEDYLLGGRKMNAVAVGISLFATLLSTLSYLSYPGELIKYGPAIFAGMMAFPFIYFIVGWWLIPRIMQMNVTSAYEILELKLGIKVRMLATFMFLSLRFLWMATIIYVTIDVAVMAVLPLDRVYVPLLGSLLMIITIAYTTMGGLRGVVVTDVIQSIIFLGGALLSILIVSLHFNSFTSWFPGEWPAYWKPLRLGFDAQERETIGNAALMLFTWYICTNGSDQLAIQRYLSTRDIRAARKSLKVALYANLLAKCLLGLVGLAVFSFFGNNQHLLADGQTLTEQADTLFPRFIVLGLPVGLSGLVIAGLLAAAMSSLSSGLNSVSAVLSEDIFKRFKRNRKKSLQADSLRRVQLFSLLAGALAIVLSLFVGNVEGNLLDIVVKVVNLFVAPLFVLFFMALFIPFATEKATFFGGIVAVAIAILIAFWSIFGITVLWIMPISFVTGAMVAVFFSWIETAIRNGSTHEKK